MSIGFGAVSETSISGQEAGAYTFLGFIIYVAEFIKAVRAERELAESVPQVTVALREL